MCVMEDLERQNDDAATVAMARNFIFHKIRAWLADMQRPKIVLQIKTNGKNGRKLFEKSLFTSLFY